MLNTPNHFLLHSLEPTTNGNSLDVKSDKIDFMSLNQEVFICL